MYLIVCYPSLLCSSGTFHSVYNILYTLAGAVEENSVVSSAVYCITCTLNDWLYCCVFFSLRDEVEFLISKQITYCTEFTCVE